MSVYIKPIDSLVGECIKDIRWEFHQIRSRIRTDEVHRLAEGLLNRTSLEWPLVLLELQKGNALNRLLEHLNFHVRRHGLPSEKELVFKGPFPSLSLRPLQAIVDTHRSTVRMARCIEFLGNKAWDHALKPVKKSLVPFKVEVATLTLNAFQCSPKHQLDVALVDLSQRIRGYIINFLCEWEALLIQQVQEQLLLYKADSYLPISEAAV
ncbi:hypothetical protein [Sporomusa sp.]|uniref:hypothetical protein n=1 Tax=Sporomusa sp. TaxID=2078658 RepID=UPI002B51C523|nr:hypothetical protein [Sporomusa sp.]HWR41907.1 hypothetical protein [Sporomusa sp.]